MLIKCDCLGRKTYPDFCQKKIKLLNGKDLKPCLVFKKCLGESEAADVLCRNFKQGRLNGLS